MRECDALWHAAGGRDCCSVVCLGTCAVPNARTALTARCCKSVVGRCAAVDAIGHAVHGLTEHATMKASATPLCFSLSSNFVQPMCIVVHCGASWRRADSSKLPPSAPLFKGCCAGQLNAKAGVCVTRHITEVRRRGCSMECSIQLF